MAKQFFLDPAVNAIFADALKRRRSALALTQGEVGDKLKDQAHGNFVSMVENGKTPVPLDKVPSFADALRIKRSIFYLAAVKAQHPKVWEVIKTILTDRDTKELVCGAANENELENIASECITRIGSVMNAHR